MTIIVVQRRVKFRQARAGSECMADTAIVYVIFRLFLFLSNQRPVLFRVTMCPVRGGRAIKFWPMR